MNGFPLETNASEWLEGSSKCHQICADVPATERILHSVRRAERKCDNQRRLSLFEHFCAKLANSQNISTAQVQTG